MKRLETIGAVLCVCVMAVALSAAFPQRAGAQGLELNGGWSHVTGDFGLDGFGVGAAWRFIPQIAVVANYDDTWDTSQIGQFEFTSVGAIASQSHLQNFLTGPRYYWGLKKIKNHAIDPFAEAQFGVSHLHSRVQEGAFPFVENSDSAFSWALGAGADYALSPHWSARVDLDLLRTHLDNDAQSRLRLVFGMSYSFGQRYHQ